MNKHLLLLPLLLLSACGSEPPEATTVLEPTVTLEAHPAGMAYGAVAGVGGVAANGIATAHYEEDGSTVVSLQVNIEPAAADHYQAWLVSPGSNERINIGTLTNPFGDVRHVLRFESENALQTYDSVEIALQRGGDDAEPGDIVASAKMVPSAP